jgi:hypothetical protein
MRGHKSLGHHKKKRFRGNGVIVRAVLPNGESYIFDLRGNPARRRASFSAWWEYLRQWLSPKPDASSENSQDREDRSTMADLTRSLEEHDFGKSR